MGFEGDLNEFPWGVDAVIHLAGRAHVMRETAVDPLAEFRKANVMGLANIASVALLRGVNRFIFLSSIKVNGESTTDRAFKADDLPGYCDPYGQSKWEAEERLRRIATGTSMEWVIVRPPLVYGPHVRGNFLQLMKSAAHGIPLPLGGVHNRRSLVSVYNLSEFLSQIVDHPGASNSRFLVSDAEDMSTPELIRRMAAAMHRPSRVLPCPESILRLSGTLLGQKAKIQRLCSSLVLDKHKTTEMLGWTAQRSVDWGLERTAEWFLKHETGKNRRVQSD